MGYYNKTLRAEVVPGKHFDLADGMPTDVIELDDTHMFYMPLEEGMELTYDADGVPEGTKPIEETAQQAIEREAAWVLEELATADIQINMHDDGDVRATHTKAAWQTHRRALRDHIVAGVIQGARPEMTPWQ